MIQFSPFHLIKTLTCVAVLVMPFQAAVAGESDIDEFLAHRESLRALPIAVTYTYKMKEYRGLGDDIALTEGAEFACLLHHRDGKYRLEIADADGKLLQLVVHNGEDTLLLAWPDGNLAKATEEVLSGEESIRPTQHLDFVRWSFRSGDGGDTASLLRTSSGSSHSNGAEVETILFSRDPASTPESEVLEWPDRADLHNWSSDRSVAGWRVPKSMREELRDRATDPSRRFVFEYENVQYEVLESLDDTLFDIALQKEAQPLLESRRAFEQSSVMGEHE